MPASFECLVFDPERLLPQQWRQAAAAGPIRTFNPGLLRDGTGWILAYRVVLPDGLRRLALCRLDDALQVVEGSQLPLSDAVRFRPAAALPEVARLWLADPRLYRWGGRVFIYWNSGWHEPQNHQFLQELHPGLLLPVGEPRELMLHGVRQPLEKNWTFFQEDGGLFAVYSIAPHRVLQFSIAGEGDIVFDEVANTPWALTNYPACHGGLRGGAPPVRLGDRYWSFCHSVHDGAHGYRYAASVYCFSPHPPFRPLMEPVRPLDLAPELRQIRAHPRLNPAVDEVIYPCGAACEHGVWLISHGLNDERCALSRLPHTAVLDSLQPCLQSS